MKIAKNILNRKALSTGKLITSTFATDISSISTSTTKTFAATTPVFQFS